MGLFDFSFLTGKPYNSASDDLPEIFNLNVDFDAFIKNDIVSLYNKILTDCITRTQGIKDTWEHALWDNCLASEGRKGLVTLLSEAMACQDDLFLVYKEDVLRLATDDEKKQIEADYKARAFSNIGVFVSFKNYRRTEILEIYSGMEFAVLGSLNKSLNLSKALQYKMSKMRDSVGLVDSSVVIDQAKTMALSLGCGRDIMMDGEDDIVTATVDMEPTEKSIRFLDSKRAFLLDLPLSYINGEQTPGIGSTGEADAKAVDRGLFQPWTSIIKPTIKSLWAADVKFKSQDFRLITVGLEAVRTLDLVSNNLITIEAKRAVASQLLNVPNDMEGEPDQTEELNVNNSGSNENPDQASTENAPEASNNPKVNGQ